MNRTYARSFASLACVVVALVSWSASALELWALREITLPSIAVLPGAAVAMPLTWKELVQIRAVVALTYSGTCQAAADGTVPGRTVIQPISHSNPPHCRVRRSAIYRGGRHLEA